MGVAGGRPDDDAHAAVPNKELWAESFPGRDVVGGLVELVKLVLSLMWRKPAGVGIDDLLGYFEPWVLISGLLIIYQS